MLGQQSLLPQQKILHFLPSAIWQMAMQYKYTYKMSFSRSLEWEYRRFIKSFDCPSSIDFARKGGGRRRAFVHQGRQRIMAESRPIGKKVFYEVFVVIPAVPSRRRWTLCRLASLGFFLRRCKAFRRPEPEYEL